MGLKYYKKYLEQEQRYQYEIRNTDSTDAQMLEITPEEYEREAAAQWNEYIASIPSQETDDKPTYEELLEKNTELEKENAALLYQVLTGEALTDD